MSGKFAIIIANTEYTDQGLAKLTAPGKDAEEFARVLNSPDIAAFDDVNVLINENATTAREAIDEFFGRKTPDDLLVLYFSGHGVRDEFGSLYLAVKNTNRDRLRSTAINSSFIREGMDQSRSRRQVLILDCCNSGAFAQGTKAEVGGSVGTASAFEGTGYGRVVLTASDSTQFAWEGDKVIGETTNSLFTHFLVKGLEGDADRDGDGTITVDELYDYAYEQIVSRTPKQTPGKWSYKQQGEIVLRQNIRIEDTRPVPLPDDLVAAINSSLPYVREGAVRQLDVLLSGRNLGLARSARLALEKIVEEDDSRHVSKIAADVLERFHVEEALDAKKAEEGRIALEQANAAKEAAREKIEREAAEKAEREAVEKAEQEKKEREQLDREEKARKEKEKEAGDLQYKGMLVQKQGKYDEAELLFRQSLEIAIQLNDEKGKANILHQLAILTRDREVRKKEEREAAEKVAKEKAEREAAEKAHRELTVEASDLQYKGMLAQKEENYDEAEYLFRRSLEIAIQLNDEQGKNNILHQLTILTQDRQTRERAKRKAAERIAQEKVEREVAEKAARERAEQEAAEKIAKEKTERGTAQKEKTEREAVEKTTRAGVKAVSNKSPFLATLLSFFFLGGAGQIYLGQWKKGITLMVVTFLSSFIFIGVIVNLAGAVDAYNIAEKMSRGEVVKEWEFGFSWKGLLIVVIFTIIIGAIFLSLSYLYS